MSKRRRVTSGFHPMDTLSNPNSSDNEVEIINNKSTYGKKRHTIKKKNDEIRYNKVRRDAKVVEKINQSSTNDFLPDIVPIPLKPLSNNMNSLKAGHSKDNDKGFNRVIKDTDLIRESHSLDSIDNDDNNKDSDNEDDNEFEILRDTSPMRRGNTSGFGLLRSSPSEKTQKKFNINTTNNNMNHNYKRNSSIAYHMPGIFKIVDKNGVYKEYDKILLDFICDTTGMRIDFKSKGESILNTSIDFTLNCKKALFNINFSCIGIELKDTRILNLHNNNIANASSSHERSNKLKTFLWKNKDGTPDSKLKKICGFISGSCDIEKRINTELELINKLRLLNKEHIEIESKLIASSSIKQAFDNVRKERKKTFLDKPIFRSLGNHNLSHNHNNSSIKLSNFTKNATKIHIPNNETQFRNDSDTSSKLINISTNNFYSNPSSSKDAPKLSIQDNNVTMNLRRSTRNSNDHQIYRLDPPSDHELEVPKVFKPSLHYKFMNGTGYTITNHHFKCLYNSDWINDNIIDFFIQYFVEKSISDSIIQRDEVHIMSSFFYTKLISDSHNYYENVKKWVQNADLFNKKHVILPINMNYHWFGCIITNLDVCLKFFLERKHNVPSDQHQPGTLTEHMNNVMSNPESEFDTENQLIPSEPIQMETDIVTLGSPIIQILTFDSLRGTHTREIDPIKDFLIAYAKDKYGLTLDKSIIKMKTCLVPQQPNMSDCGVHVILTVQKYFEDPKRTMEIWKSAKIRNKSSFKMINEFFERNKRNKARKMLRSILWSLQKDQIERMGDTREESKKEADDEDEDIEIIENILTKIKPEGVIGTVGDEADITTPSISATGGLTSDPPSSGPSQNPSEVEDDAHHGTNRETPQNSPSVHAQGSESILNSSTHDRLDIIPSSPIDSIPHPIFDIERITNRKFLEGSPSKSAISRETGTQKLVSRYFKRPTLSDSEKDEDFFRPSPPESFSPVRAKAVHSTNSRPHSPEPSVSTLAADISQKIVVSDGEPDLDVNLIGYETDISQTDSNDKSISSGKTDRAAAISLKVDRELHNNDIPEFSNNDESYPGKNSLGEQISEFTSSSPKANKIPQTQHYHTISLDDE